MARFDDKNTPSVIDREKNSFDNKGTQKTRPISKPRAREVKMDKSPVFASQSSEQSSPEMQRARARVGGGHAGNPSRRPCASYTTVIHPHDSTTPTSMRHRPWQPQSLPPKHPLSQPRGKMALLLVPLLVLGLFARPSLQQADPQLDQDDYFCRRFGHQATIVDDALYVDGGYLNYNPISQYNNNYTSEFSIRNPKSYILRGSAKQTFIS